MPEAGDFYVARYAGATGEFSTTVCRWPAPPGPLLPAAWLGMLRSESTVDIALRLTFGPHPHILLLLTAGPTDAGRAMLASLSAAAPIPGLAVPRTAAEFDAFVSESVPREQLTVGYDGYRSNGQDLGLDFRLYAALIGQSPPDGSAYQLVLRAQTVDAAQERRARKYLAWLDLEQPFTAPVREMQRLLAKRLLSPGWLGDEYLMFRDSQSRKTWEEGARRHFMETIGRNGFRDLPLEAGDFTEWLTTGCHTARDRDIFPEVPLQGSRTFSEDEIARLAAISLMQSTTKLLDQPPQIFVSYASSDFVWADATRQHLESLGWRCWIAPRDVNSGGMPYTEAISRALRRVRVVVVVLSEAANLSVHVPREIDLALEQKLPLVPLRLSNLRPVGQLDFLLRTCQWLDLFDREFEDAMAELRGRLHSLQV